MTYSKAILSPFAPLLFFSQMGFHLGVQQVGVVFSRVLLFVCTLGMWLYTWTMVTPDVWAKIGLTYHQEVWYILVTEVICFSTGSRYREVEYRLKDGSFDMYLVRPFSWLRQWLAGETGMIGFNVLCFGGAALLLGYLVTGTLPFSPVLTAVLLLKMALGLIVWLGLTALVGLTALWMGTASIAYWVLQKSAFVLGALLIPLMLYPQWLQTAVYFTPYPAVFAVPGAMMLPHAMDHPFSGIIYQLVTILCVYALVYLLWRAFQNKILQEG